MNADPMVAERRLQAVDNDAAIDEAIQAVAEAESYPVVTATDGAESQAWPVPQLGSMRPQLPGR